MDLKGKTALITGGSSGIGKAIAQAFIKKGAKIIILGRHKPDYKCEFHKVDIGKEEEIEEAVSKLGKIDVLVNNAGIALGDFLEDAKKEDIERTIDINLKGPIYMSKYSIPKINKGGCIINISSKLGIKADIETSIYNATKAAIINLTETLAQELAEKGIRVNSIAPGIIYTPIFEKYYGSKKEADKYIRESVQNYPIKRPGKPEEIAHAAIFLVENEFVTGTTIRVDGGATAI